MQPTYLQVIIQVSGKYFPETSGFSKNSSVTHENIGVLNCVLPNVTFIFYIEFLQVPRLSKANLETSLFI